MSITTEQLRVLKELLFESIAYYNNSPQREYPIAVFRHSEDCEEWMDDCCEKVVEIDIAAELERREAEEPRAVQWGLNFEEIMDEAYQLHKKWSQKEGYRGQLVLPQDSINYWIMEATRLRVTAQVVEGGAE